MKKLLTKHFYIFFTLSLLVLGLIFLSWFNYQGMLCVLVDEVAHLNISRQILDSMTPGFSQLGLWPPLLHLIIAPFAQIDYLWRTGFAGAIPAIVCFIITSVYLFKILEFLLKSRELAIVGVIIFVFNPYIAYFSTVAMMEILFLMCLVVIVYYYILWEENRKISYLVLFSVFIFLASIARYEGLILPFLFLVLILLQKLFAKKVWKKGELEAVLIIFFFLSCFGGVIVLIYNFIFADNPLSFVSGEWSAFAQQNYGGFLLPAKNNIINAIEYMIYATAHMVSWEYVVLTVLSVLLLAIGRKTQELKVLMILAIPFLFNIIAMYRGSTVIYVPDLFPYERFFNVRYGLLIMPCVAVALPLLIQQLRYRFTKHFMVAVLLLCTGSFFVMHLSASNSVIYQEGKGYPSITAQEMSGVLKEHYDGGKVLLMRSLNDYVVFSSGIMIKDTINESNYLYWQQALDKPWFFARWILMSNAKESHMVWEVRQDKISAQWLDNELLDRFYVKVYGNQDYILFKIKEDVVQEVVEVNRLNINKVPSLNTQIDSWKPENIRQEIGY